MLLNIDKIIYFYQNFTFKKIFRTAASSRQRCLRAIPWPSSYPMAFEVPLLSGYHWFLGTIPSKLLFSPCHHSFTIILNLFIISLSFSTYSFAFHFYFKFFINKFFYFFFFFLLLKIILILLFLYFFFIFSIYYISIFILFILLLCLYSFLSFYFNYFFFNI